MRSSPASSVHVVLVHGVGAPALGSTLADALEGLGKAKVTPPAFRRGDLHISGFAYPRAVAVAPGRVASVTEVNWADLLKPKPGAAGTLRHVVLLSFALLDAAVQVNAAWRVRQFRVVFAAAFCWCIWPALIGFVAAMFPTPAWVAITAALLLSCFVGGIGWYLGRYNIWARVGGLASATIAFVLACWTHADPAARVEWAARLYALGQTLGVGSALLAASAVVFSRPWTKRTLGHLGLLFTPVALAAAGGAVLWSVALWALRGSDKVFNDWGTAFSRGLGYNLKHVEWTAAGATGAIGVLAIVAAIVWWIDHTREKRGPLQPRSGERAQVWMSVILFMAHASFLAATGTLLYSLVAGWRAEPTVYAGDAILEIYRTSALRVVPYLVGLLGVLNVVMDVLGDVAFYVAETPRLGIQKDAKARLQTLLETLAAPGRRLMVVAHSQGSLVAAHVLADTTAPHAELVTVGSPVHSLYDTFLGYPGTAWPDALGSRWRNLVRDGDYIGGRIPVANNEPLGAGGHIGYFKDKGLWQRIFGTVPPALEAERS